MPSTSGASSSAAAAPPVPTLDFNLFRSNSVYSVDSVSSLSTVTTDDDGPIALATATAAIVRPESPTTPKASQFPGREGYFDSYAQAEAGPSRLQGSIHTASTGTLTPKKSFVVRSRDHDQPSPPIFQRSIPDDRAVYPGRPRSHSRPEPPARSHSQIRSGPSHQPDPEDSIPDFASVHGEQGSDWGDDEETFEWLDTQNAPEATNGTGKHYGGGLSPSKRLSRIKAAVKPVGHGSGQEGRRLRKQLTFARKAPPPPPGQESAPPPVFPESGEATTPPATAQPRPPGLQRGLSRSKRFHGNPLQPTTSQPTAERRPMAERTQSSPVTAPADSLHHPVPLHKNPPPPITAAPTLVPLKDDRVAALMPKNQSRNSQMSFQSVAYSLYDLDGDSTSPLPSPGPGSELVFPKGRYTRVKASAIDIDGDKRTRKGSDRSLGSGHTIGKSDIQRTPEEFVSAGIESRGRGDLAKSAWYFMKATEGGSLTGKMYYGGSSAALVYPDVIN